MADLYNLLEDLENNEAGEAQHEEDHSDDDYDGHVKPNDPRRQTMETAVMSENLEDDDGEHGFGLESPAEMGRFLQRPSSNTRPEVGEDDGRNRDAEAAEFFADLEGGTFTTILPEIDGPQDKELPKMVPNKLSARLHQFWLQERHCPELLPYDARLFTTLVDAMEEQQRGIDGIQDSSNPSDLLVANIAQQDMDRVKFVLSNWLTQRLNKIEQHPLHNLKEQIGNMSEQEQQYLYDYTETMKRFLNATVLNNLQEAWRTLDAPNMIDTPDYEGYHFWFVTENILDKDGAEHEAGVCLVAKYLHMKDHMSKNKVKLLI